MSQPSPRAHLFRLAGLLIVGFGVFVLVLNAMVPASWNREGDYREDSLVELAQRPSVHGGNASCVGCHGDAEESHETAMEDLSGGVHKSLSCESCHGPLAHHVRDNKKIAEARVEYNRMVCLGCHDNSISLPAAFPKFILADEVISPAREAELLEAAKASGGTKYYRHKKKIHAGMNCVECHYSFHDPEP